MPRPRLPVLRDRQLNLRLTRAEFEGVKARADSSGLRIVDYGRAVLLGDKAVLARASAGSAAERLIHAQLRRLGNNLNQLVRHLHMTKEPPPANLEPLLQDIRQALRSRSHGS